jgi:hypothetical protein
MSINANARIEKRKKPPWAGCIVVKEERNLKAREKINEH